MQTIKTSEVGAKLRAHVAQAMAALDIPKSTPAGEPAARREDGVLEFYKHWRVRGQEGSTDGLYATFSDHEDVIEFGLTERQGDVVVNVLLATLNLEEGHGELNVISEADSELNVDAIVSPGGAKALDAALALFAQHMTAVA
jgi:hypothetical protein